jgi:tRNA threonylcarbamoyladenosine biosynthesis protein TsaB
MTRPPTSLLVLEASTSTGSVALFVAGTLTASRAFVMGPSRADEMLPAIAAVLGEAGMRTVDLRGIACGSGPGSFTSLRIAAALTKGLSVPHDTPVYVIPSLLLAGASLAASPGCYVLHADALRGERYALRVRVAESGEVTSTEAAHRLSLADVEAMASTAAPPCMLVAVGAHTVSAHDALAVTPDARRAGALFTRWDRFGPVDVARWEPEYGRLAEAQVKWESTHGSPLPVV